MSRVLLLIVASLCVASSLVVQTTALRSVAAKAPVRAASPSMMVEEAQVAMTTVDSISSALASTSGDFGGMTIPIIGLSLLSAIIAFLAGPVED